MKYLTFIFLFGAMVLSSCNQIDHIESIEDLRVVKDDETVLDLSDIEYYDFSSHILYLTENNRMDGNLSTIDGGYVKINEQIIYPLMVNSGYQSSLPTVPFVDNGIGQFGNHAIQISYIRDTEIAKDPRNDQRIIKSLKKANKYRGGLSVEIQALSNEDFNKVRLRFKLTNNDSGDYLHLDPYKMGLELFNYFTNGPVFLDPQTPELIYHQVPTEHPESHLFWDINWMSVIKGKESKIYNLEYDFDALPKNAQLTCHFLFPGLTFQITERSDLEQAQGRIWLGETKTSKTVMFR